MDRQEAVQKLATVGPLSMAHAEDLYDSFFPKPVVKQYVADWYEGNKQNLDLNLCGLVYDLTNSSMLSVREELKAWVNDNKKTFITTLVNMHQFGYEVEKETKYTVRIKVTNQYLCNDEGHLHFSPGFRTDFTKTDLEKSDFGWVFDCEGVEVEEVTNELI